MYWLQVSTDIAYLQGFDPASIAAHQISAKASNVICAKLYPIHGLKIIPCFSFPISGCNSNKLKKMTQSRFFAMLVSCQAVV